MLPPQAGLLNHSTQTESEEEIDCGLSGKRGEIATIIFH